MTDSAISAANGPDTTRSELSHPAGIETDELRSRVLPPLVAMAKEQIAQGTRQAARQQVDRAFELAHMALARQAMEQISDVYSTLREQLDGSLEALRVEWLKQVEWALDPIRSAAARGAVKAVEAALSNSAIVSALGDSDRRESDEMPPDAPGRQTVKTKREPRAAKKSARRSAADASSADGNKTTKKRAQETKPKQQSKVKEKEKEKEAARPAASSTTNVSGKSSSAKKSEAAPSAEKSPRRSSTRQSATRSTAGSTSATHTPPNGRQSRRKGDEIHADAGKERAKQK